jgi:hypothetical protein
MAAHLHRRDAPYVHVTRRVTWWRQPPLAAVAIAPNPNTHLVRNGVDYPLFASARDRATPVAAELAGLRPPIVGCVTRIVPDYFDAVLLREIFSRRPDWSFVVVGRSVRARKRSPR